jgi:mannose-1-phosphate guanylyltransferase
MAGGIGSRFWPLSRKEKPKQFLDILGTGETLIQITYKRFKGICPEDHIYIVTSEESRETVTEQLDINSSHVLAEPMRRNTAPCIAYGIFRIMAENPDAVIAVAPSDHLIQKEDEFIEVMNEAYRFASENDALLTLGIKPDRPETGYGYIQAHKEHPVNGFTNLHKVKAFTEKPELAMARLFIESGDFYWNSGILSGRPAQYYQLSKSTCLIYIMFSMKAGSCSTLLRKMSSYSRHMLNAAAYPLTTASWKRPIMCMLFALTWDGPTWAHGTPSICIPGMTGVIMQFFVRRCSHTIRKHYQSPRGKDSRDTGMDDYIIIDSGDILIVPRIRSRTSSGILTT